MKGNINNAINLAAHPKWNQTNITYEFYTGSLPNFYTGTNSVTHYLDSSGNPLVYATAFDPAGFNTEEQGVATGAFNKLATFLNLTFTPAAPGEDATLGFAAFLPSYSLSVAAYASTGSHAADKTDAGDIWITGFARIPSAASAADFGYKAIPHEIGHALGLKHAFDIVGDKPALTGDENTQSFSIMTTNRVVGASPPYVVYDYQLYDIASLQYLYGPNTSFHSSTDAWGWFDFVLVNHGTGNLQSRYFSIWDAGGDDTIIAKADELMPNLAAAAYIDLRPGYFSSLGVDTLVGLVDGHVSNAGIQNVSIAFGAYIENAQGTIKTDVLIGNNFSNLLGGDKGDDLILGSGSAIATANAHADDLGIAGGTGITDTDAGDYSKIAQGHIDTQAAPDEADSADVLHGGDDNDIIVAGAGATSLYGDAGNDRLMGGGASDRLEGGDGNDKLWGLDGNDILDAVTNDTGHDDLYGGDGADIFKTNNGDVIHDMGADLAVFFKGIRLAGGARLTDAATSGDLTGHYVNDYTLTTYDYARVGNDWVLTVTASPESGGGQLVIHDFQDGEGGIFLKAFTQGSPYEGSNDERPPVAGDPLMLDLNGDGVRLTDIETKEVYFDTNGDGFVERVGWVGPDDGLLARDLNGDGLINNRSELFGTDTVDGFTVLAGYDDNHDGVINACDAIWSTLRVWRDANTDGDTDAGELRTLAQVGITSISLTAEPVDLEAGGNDIPFRGSFTWADGNLGEAVAAFIKIARADPFISGEGWFEDAEVALLPELSARDEVRSLRAAMAADADLKADVRALVENVRTMDSADFRAAFEDVLLRWAGVAGIDPDSRGPNVDARHLAFVQQITGDPQYARGAGGGFEDVSYYPGLGADIEVRFTEIVNQYMMRFGSQLAASEAQLGIDADAILDGPFAGLFHGTAEYHLETNVQHFSPTEMGFWIARNAPATAADALAYLGTTMPFLQGIAYLPSLFMFGRSWAEAETALGAGLIAGGMADSALLEFAVDRAHGSERALVRGTGGEDGLAADPTRSTTFIGGAGDDVLTGGELADTYVYAAGDGEDVIQEYDDSGIPLSSGAHPFDRLLMVGLNAADVTLSADGDDILLTIAGGGVIRLVGQLAGAGIEQIVFANGDRYTASDLASLTFDAPISAGDDEIVGTRFNDTIDGLAGNDQIYGNDGNDTLTGGVGDDMIYGGLGDDSYIYNAGDGDDVVVAASGDWTDYERLRFVGIDPDDVVVRRHADGVSLVFEIGGSLPGTVTVIPSEGDLGIDEVQFDGGLFWTRVELGARAVSSQATDGDDHIVGINAPFGEDILAGGRGDDLLEGLAGYDTYQYRLGDGHDTILDNSTDGTNGLMLFGILRADVHFERVGDYQDYLVLHVDLPEGGSITFHNDAVERIWFADGTSMTPAEIMTEVLLTQPTGSDDVIFGTLADDVIHALGGSDRIEDNGGDNLIDGGAGDDLILTSGGVVRGGLGDDDIQASGIVEYAAGDGDDILRGFETQLHLTNIAAADVTFSFGATQGDLLITIGGAQPGSILVAEQWGGMFGEFGGIAEITFADGSKITDAAIADALLDALGTAGDDTIVGVGVRADTLRGRGGSDSLSGGEADDTYIYGDGDGDDVIADDGASVFLGTGDRLVLHGIDPADVAVTQSGGDAVLSFAGGGSITISGALASLNVIEKILFDDGTQWLATELYRQADPAGDDASLTGTSGADTLTGTGSDETYDGGTGDDILVDRGGSDVYLFGLGDGHDVVEYESPFGAPSVDILRIDALPADIVVTTIAFATQFRLLATGETITFQTGKVDFVEFSDGTRWDGDRIAREAVIRGTSGNDALEGRFGQYDENFLGGAGNDTITPWGGNDTFIYRAGDGFLTIDPYYGSEDLYLGRTDTDTLWLRDIDPEDVILSIEPDYTNFGDNPQRVFAGEADLVVRFAGMVGAVRIRENFDQLFAPDGLLALERIKFDDGTIWTIEDMMARLGSFGTALPDILFSSDYGSRVIQGFAGNDRIFEATDGDVIRWSVGDGNDRIIRADLGASLELLDIDSTEATFSRDGEDLLITIGSETLRVERQFSRGGTHPVQVGGETVQMPYDRGIAAVIFADAVTVTRETLFQDFVAPGTAGSDELTGSRFDEAFSGGDGADAIEALDGGDLVDGGGGADVLDGGDGNDELTGGMGDDQLEGGLGSDVYAWTLGDGNDLITDQGGRFDGIDELRLVGVDLADVVFERLRVADENHPYDALRITIISTGEVITIANQYFVEYLAADYMEQARHVGDGADLPAFPLTYFVRGLERIVFDDGSVINPQQIGGGELFANADVIEVSPDGNLVFRPDMLLANDIAPFGAASHVLSAGDAEHGTVVLNDDGTLTFTAEASFLGMASFTYTILSGGHQATAQVMVKVAERAPILGTEDDDTLNGTDFDDRFVGGEGSDWIDAGWGVDISVYAGSSIDFLIYREADGSIVVGDQVGNEGWDVLYGVEFLSFGGDETVIAVADLPAYGTGDDDVIAGTERNDYLVGLDGNDALSGGNRDDRLVGGEFADTLTGGGGNDTLAGDAGADLMTGGLGDDYYEVDNLGDAVVEFEGEGYDSVFATIDYILGSNVEELAIGGAAAFAMGNALDNVIYGNWEAASHLMGQDGNDQLVGGAMNDMLEGGSGADDLDGGLGNDIMAGGLGDDVYIVENSGDMVLEFASSGADEVRTTLASYALEANVERLTGLSDTGQELVGNNLANILSGGAGADMLDGGLGNDEYQLGLGDDLTSDDGGNELYQYAIGNGDDEIRDTDGVDALIFGEGISADDVIVSAGSGNSIVLSFGAMAGSVTLVGAQLEDNAIEEVRFADGTIWTAADLEAVLTPVNHAPVAGSPIDPLISNEDMPIDWALPAGSFVDADGDDLTITATLADGSPLPSWLEFDGERFTGTPPANFHGTLDLTLTASDGSLDGEASLELRILPVNDAPAVDHPLANVHSTEDQAVDLLVPEDLFSDIDGDTLALQATLQNGNPMPTWLHFDGERFTGTPPANFNGSIALRVTASDGALSASHDFSLIIDPANDAPLLQLPILDAVWRAGAAQSLTLASGTFSDLDGDSLTLSATLADGSALPSWLSFDPVTRIFSGTGPSGTARLTIRVTASDGMQSASDDFYLAIVGPFANTTNGTGSNNTLNGTSSTDEINGLGGDDTLSGAAANDLLDGGIGNDRLIGGAGADALIGGDGFDWADYSTNGAALVLDLYNGSQTTGDAVGDTYVGIESYVGTGFADTFIAGATATTFDGGSGSFSVADTVDYSLSTSGITLTLYVPNGTSPVTTGTGAGGLAEGDVLYSIERFIGTSYDDVYIVTYGPLATSIAFVEAVNGGTDEVRTDRSAYALGSNIEKLTYIGTSDFTGTGNALNNILTGAAGSDRLIGGAGADALIGGDGFDWADYSTNGAALVLDLYNGSQTTGDAVGDTYTGIEGYAGTSLADTFIAGATATAFDGGSGSFSVADTVDYSLSTSGITLTLYVPNGTSPVTTGTGAGGLAEGDVLYSIERFIGTSYDDVYIVTYGPLATSIAFVETVNGGTDEVRTDRSAYTLGSNIEKLTYIGTSDFTGTGNALNNILTGGARNDSLTGSAGADSFCFVTALAANNVDTIADFVSGTDRIRLDDAIFSGIGSLGTLGSNAFVVGSAAADADDRIIYNSATGQLLFDADGNGAGAAVLFATLTGAPTVTASDFLVI